MDINLLYYSILILWCSSRWTYDFTHLFSWLFL